MSDLTRRDALMLTAAIAATTSSARVVEADAAAPANNSNLPDDNTLLTVPSGTVANTSIPISLKIPVATFAPAPNNVVLSMVQIALTASDLSPSPKDHSIFTATLQGAALPAFNKDQTPAIALMTRLKVDWDKTATSQTPQTNVVATVTMTLP